MSVPTVAACKRTGYGVSKCRLYIRRELWMNGAGSIVAILMYTIDNGARPIVESLIYVRACKRSAGYKKSLIKTLVLIKFDDNIQQ